MRLMIAQMRSDIIHIPMREESFTLRRPDQLLSDPTYLEDASGDNAFIWKMEMLAKLHVDGESIGSQEDQFG
ncbi:hypothetical protein PC116_g29480, partial [Phytophthora cactorum]